MLDRVGLRPEARFVVFHCADEVLRYIDGSNSYYESVDLIDAFHPQTILAYETERRSRCLLPTARRCVSRVERQLGYKMAKYITRIEAVDRLDNIAGGRADIGKTPATSGMWNLRRKPAPEQFKR